MRRRTLRDDLQALHLAEELEENALRRHREATEAASEAAKECQQAALELRCAVTRRREAERALS